MSLSLPQNNFTLTRTVFTNIVSLSTAVMSWAIFISSIVMIDKRNKDKWTLYIYNENQMTLEIFETESKLSYIFVLNF